MLNRRYAHLHSPMPPSITFLVAFPTPGGWGIYWNRLRILADTKGFRLDDTGLFPATHGSGGTRVRNNAFVLCGLFIVVIMV